MIYLGWKNKNRLVDETIAFLVSNVPYRYDEKSHRREIGNIAVPRPSTFRVNHLSLSQVDATLPVKDHVPHKIFVCWTGDNEMGESRLESLERIIRDNPEFDVVVVTRNNYKDFMLPDHPFHPVYEKLSYVHRSDYLRAYLMYYYGGVYTDIKMLSKPWAEIVLRLNNSDHWAAGPHEISSHNVSSASGKLGLQQRLYWKKILWQSAFAFKPRTPFAQEWLEEVERRLDYFSRPLHNSNSGDPVWGLDEAYPIPWNAILGQIFSPLCLKYNDKIIIDNGMEFVVNQEGYR